MKFFAAASLLAALSATALPTVAPIFRRQTVTGAPTDTQVLQYALTLENLEKTFYADALSKFDATAFTNAGFPDWVRGRISQIAEHESEHVSSLSGALGNMSVAACNYSFPYTDPRSFLNLAVLIENVGVSAYAGAAQYITSKTYLTIAAVILSTEARHQAWESSAALTGQPWSSAYDTPLGLDMVYTIASQFITSCPSTNAALPVKAFPTLTLSSPTVGTTSTFEFTGSTKMDGVVKYAIFYSGLGSKVVKLDQNNSAAIPSNLQGIAYVIVSTVGAVTDVTDSNIVAGPALIVNPFNAFTANVAFS